MYTPLKVTTEYSLLNSLIKIDDLITFLLDKNICACGVVDNNLSYVYEFYLKCKKNNIKPIIGLEVILDNKKIYLYAKNYDGYKNLLKINTAVENNKLNIDLLNAYSNNILVMLPYSSKDLFNELSFFENIYITYSNSNELINAKVITNNTVFINDIKVLKESDLKYLNILDKLSGRDEIKYSNNYYIKKNELINEEEINNIVSLIDLELPFNNRYIPKYRIDIDSYKFLSNLAIKGLNKRLNNNVSDKYIKRLNYELDVIKRMNFVDYFLIVYDYVLYAKKNNILVGPARGSAAGSLVSYSIGITDIDPIKYDLMFERFLNPKRISMPDIDIDFDATKRDLVIDYVKNKYGNYNVALGLTYNTYKTKLVLRDIARILNIDSALLDNFLKVIDGNKNLKANLFDKRVKSYLNNYKELKELYNISIKLENLKKNRSIHAAGVVISSIELDKIIPIFIDNDKIITGVTMDYLESIGLLKMDFLALKNLTTIANIMKKINNIDLKNINLEDKKVFSLFNKIDVDGIFQFETPVMKKFLNTFKIDSFDDLVVALALVRPGPKEYTDTYIRRKKGLDKVTYLHPDLESILKSTYGIILYQEQIMAILTKIAGFSLSEADIIRRAISKKNEKIIKEEKNKFIDSSIKNGYKSDIAEAIYNQIVKFASYGFNKSHSVAYATISYQMAYLKTYYPLYFLLEQIDSTNNIKDYLSVIKKNNINIIKPSVIFDNNNIVIKDNNLYLPLNIIKGISAELTNKIIELNKYNMNDFIDFISLSYNFIDKDTYELLIKAGALDCFKLNQQTMINNLDNIINYATISGGLNNLIEKPELVEYFEYSKDTLRKNEIDLYGFYITNHPSSKYNNYLKLDSLKNNCFKKVKCAVIIDNIKIIKTKNGEEMAFLKCSDEVASASFTVFPNRFNLVKNIEKNGFYIIEGEVSKRFDKYQIIVNNIFKDVEENGR